MVLQIIILLVLICISGFLSACEMAFLSIDKIILKEKVKLGHEKSIKINNMLENSDRFLATIQIAITIIGFFISVYTAETFANQIVALFSFTFISVEVLRTIVIIVLTIIITYLTMLFGILLPKRIALQNPERLSYKTINFYIALMYILYPFSTLLSNSVELIVKIFKINKKENPKVTESDVKKIIIMGSNDGAIKPIEEELMLNVLKFNDTKIEEIMTGKEKMHCIDINMNIDQIMNIVKENKFTRYPVYADNVDNVVGILNLKNFINSYLNNEFIDIKSLLRDVLYVSKNEKIVKVFKIMQDKSLGMCIVKNQETIVGLITLEDILEEIVGNMYDEYGA